MSTDDSSTTTFTSICLILLRETRLERNIHQAYIAEQLGKSPSAWTKIETGRSPLTFEVLFRTCQSMNLWPSAVLGATERYGQLFANNGVAVVSTELGFNEDTLLSEAQEYYGSPGFRARTRIWGFEALNGPHWGQNGTVTMPDVFRFVLDPQFKEEQLAPQQPLPSALTRYSGNSSQV